MIFLFDDTLDAPVKRGRKAHFNPRPPVPATGWKRPSGFPDLSDAHAITWDFETYDPNLLDLGPGWGRGEGHPVGLCVASDTGFKGYFPFAHEDEPEDNFREKDVRDWMAGYRCRRFDHITNVYWNGGYDLGWERQWGIDPAEIIYDGWVAEKLLLSSVSRRKGNSGASLEESGQRRVGKGKKSVEMLRWIHQYFGKGPTPKDEDLDSALKAFIYKTPPRLVGPYGESDGTLPLEIGIVQRKLLEERGQWELFQMECDLLPLFCQIRYEGVTADQQAAEIAEKETAIEVRTLHAEVNHIAGCHVEFTKASQVGKVLTERGHTVPLTEKTKQFSVDKELLTELALDDIFAKKVLELREVSKFHKDFIVGCVLNNSVKGRIHGTLKPFGTITGRLSQEAPNLQQIPSRNARLSKIVRSIFIPDDGHSHWEKRDYSQLQCRILAHYAEGRGSDALRAEYVANPATNYHKRAHKMILETSGRDLDHKYVKGTNFSLIFGAALKKVAKLIQLPDEEAEPFFNAYHNGLPYVSETMEAISRKTAKIGYSETILGRRVEFDLWEGKYQPYSKERKSYLYAEAIQRFGSSIERAYLHKATNYTIQGSEADLVKKALWQCLKDGVFEVTGVPKLLVHDEWDLSVKDDSDDMREALNEMHRIMETAVEFKVPIIASRERGTSWGTCEEF